MAAPPPWRARLAPVRLDDLLAVAAVTCFLVLAALTSADPLGVTSRNFLGLLAYYAVVAGLGAAVRRLEGRSRLLGMGLVALGVGAVAVVTLALPDGEVGLDGVRNFLVLSFPLWAAALTPPAPGQPSGLARGVGIARDWGPYLVCVALYLSLHDVVSQVSPVDRDGWLIAADEALFGGHASVALERYVTPVRTEWLSMCYSLYVFFPLTLGVLLLARGERRRFLTLLEASILASWLGFLGYLLVPAVGPMYTLAYLYAGPLEGGPLYQVKEGLDALRIPRDCFPSLHTAHTLIVLWGAWSYRRWLGLVYAPFCLSCVLATLYLRYHYAVDVVAGAALAAGCVAVAPGLSRAWERFKVGGRGAEGQSIASGPP